MANREFRRSLAVFPIGTVMELTGLTARKIRYYEEYHLIEPKRSETNRRLYSLNDIDRLLEVADMIEDGMTLKGIQRKFQSDSQPQTHSNHQLTDQDVRRILRDELGMESRFN